MFQKCVLSYYYPVVPTLITYLIQAFTREIKCITFWYDVPIRTAQNSRVGMSDIRKTSILTSK